MTPFTKRLHAAGMDVPMCSFLTNISEARLKEHARGLSTLTNAELDRIDRAIRHKPIVFSVWKRAAEDGSAVTISTVDGVMKVEPSPK